MSRALSLADLPPELQRQLGAAARGAGTRAKPRDLEHQEQADLFAWSERPDVRRRFPVLALLFAVPNFARVSKRYGARMKAEGKKAGVPDVCLPVARGPYHGLWIEMKEPEQRRKPTAEQLRWHDMLRAAGHRVEVCYSSEAATAVLIDYLTAPDSGREEARCPTSST